MKKLYIAMMLLILFIFTSCGIGHIEDTNGDDTELCSLTKDDIISEHTSYVSEGRVEMAKQSGQMLSVMKLSGVYN